MALTFDDGLLEHYTVVFPELEKRNIKGSFCINGAKIEEATAGKDNDRMKWHMLEEMAYAGHEITNHGWAHLKVWRLNQEELRYEVQHNDSAIYEHTGQFPRTYVFPGNSKTDSAISFCSKDRVGLRMKQIALGGKADFSKLRSQIEAAIKDHESIIGMTHGISRGYDCFDSISHFITLLEQIVTYRDSIWIGTLHDILSYEALISNTTFKEYNDNYGKLRSLEIKCNLPKDIYDCILTLKIPKSQLLNNSVKVMQDDKLLQYYFTESSIVINFNPHGSSITFIENRDI